ncbi:MAG: hypothetical protein COS76_00630 [Candidatus Portnoybacteria bacterium CG06_land_8_20_14_3_00_39_12]|uniref:Amidohydrolase 3 domain-containing protein n=1 Tax=Candidatus Portnoybacteria bacterium CG06_land_8_20_14_3_00_39_12 TaxID=1974809 RepID=A0A2M7AXV1_9BACT|nr:MAG: hypothetical protein COS76_00630 [Candidatus Portnoybacteria bacterium CG06_land_8_20_14_3_00_39_12]
MYSIIIKNGTIIDGSGKEKHQADLGIKDDLIAKIKPEINAKAEQVIDATGLYVCPGFIDIFNHSDDYWTLFTHSGQESLLYQGITTILGGNAGSSLAPLINAQVIENIRKWANINEVMVNWQKMSEYLSELNRRKLSLNYATLVGYETLCRGLTGNTIRSLDAKEITALIFVLQDALKQGSFGLSNGLSFSYANLINQNSLVEILKATAKNNGFYSVHIRGEKEEFLPSIKNAIDVASQSKVSLEINHLKVLGPENWSQMDEALNLINQANRAGVKVNFDVYPYTVTGSSLMVLLPDWLAEGNNHTILNRLDDPIVRMRAIKEMGSMPYDYGKVIIAQAKQTSFVGKTINQIAENESCSPEQAVINILLANEGHVIVFIDALSEDNLKKTLAHPLSLVATDGTGYNSSFGKNGLLVHPRSFGAFPRVLSKYVREKEILSWEQGIAKMTSLPAQKIGFKKRGLLAIGNFADVVIFNPRTIQDRATFDNPFQYATGVEYLLINGQATIEKGKHNSRAVGRVLVKK